MKNSCADQIKTKVVECMSFVQDTVNMCNCVGILAETFPGGGKNSCTFYSN